MRFALLGDHPDGLQMARALAGSGRHVLGTYSGSKAGAEQLRAWGLVFAPVRDVEEVLADPAIEAVIVAGRLADRPAQLRRALQSERHVLCVYPPDLTPDIAYEAAMIQGDTQRVLLPLLPRTLHPGIVGLEQWLRGDDPSDVQVVELEQTSATAVVQDPQLARQRFSLPDWDVLWAVGGEIAEVSGLATGEEWNPAEPLLLTGRFARGGLFRASFLPHPTPWRLTVMASGGRAELVFPEGWQQAGFLQCRTKSGLEREGRWGGNEHWSALVEVFEQAVSAQRGARVGSRGPTWQTAVRCLELDDAALRSLQRRRVSTLEYPEATEEAGFKGTMTLVGCALIWLILVLLVLSRWVPWLGWTIIPVLAIFLGLQLLRWILPRQGDKETGKQGAQPDD